jgi:hypothetical protein
MAGRLVISRQKSYCPWKAENVARAVRKEKERVAAEKAKDKVALQRALETRSRLENSTDHHPRHVNLFEKEEKEYHLLNELSSQAPKDNEPSRRCTAVYLDQTTRQMSQRSTSKKDEQAKLEKEKRDLDPMKEFHQRTDSRKEYEKRDKKKKDRKRHHRSEGMKNSLEELRKRRMAREAEERDREQAIINSRTC